MHKRNRILCVSQPGEWDTYAQEGGVFIIIISFQKKKRIREKEMRQRKLALPRQLVDAPSWHRIGRKKQNRSSKVARSTFSFSTTLSLLNQYIILFFFRALTTEENLELMEEPGADYNKKIPLQYHKNLTLEIIPRVK